jgi:hypothetical protein
LNSQEYIQSRIKILKKSIKTFNILSITLIIVGIIILLLAITINVSEKIIIEYVKFGFGIINLIVPMYLQGEKSKRKNKILDLEYLKSNISNSDLIENTLFNKILEKL